VSTALAGSTDHYAPAAPATIEKVVAALQANRIGVRVVDAGEDAPAGPPMMRTGRR